MELKSRLFTRASVSIIIAFVTFLVIHVRIVLKFQENSKEPRKESVQYLKNLDQNILCYQSKENDQLQSADNSNFSDSDKLIFFHETSCKGGLDSRQACAIETAARSNPDWNIYVLFAGPVDSYALSSATFKTLLQFDNIQMKRIHPLQYSKGTPMEKVFAENYFKTSSYPVHHASDAIRFLTLYKHGGVHLDLDMIVLRSFNSLSKNFFAIQDARYNVGTPVGTAILRLSMDVIGRTFSEATVDEFVHNYEPFNWDANGPELLSRVLLNFCSEDNVYDMTAETCHGLEIYPQLRFFPLAYTNSTILFLEGDLNMFVEDTFTIHIWNKLTQTYDSLKDTVYEKLAQNYCPSIFKLYGRYFGW